MKIEVIDFAVKKIKQGVPILRLEDLANGAQSIESDDFVSFVSKKGEILSTGYLSKQNKGIGWIVGGKDAKIEAPFFAQLFQVAKEKRAFLFRDESTTAFRIFNGEGDGFGGITLDWYDHFVVVSLYNRFVAKRFTEIQQSLLAVFPEIRGIIVKNRFERKEEPESAQVYGETPPNPLIILENGVKYATYLNEGWMTGIFLDQRMVRGRLLEQESFGKKMLNMFSYTGAFSVASALGGASQTTSVDLAKRSIPKTKEQFTINGIDAESQKIYAMDVFEYFQYAKKKGLKYDIIVLDPPSFARNKKKTFRVAKNYGELITASVEILEKNGTIVASTNAANVSKKQFLSSITQALEGKNVRYTIQHFERLPEDFSAHPHFSESDYLKVYFIEVY